MTGKVAFNNNVSSIAINGHWYGKKIDKNAVNGELCCLCYWLFSLGAGFKTFFFFVRAIAGAIQLSHH